MRGYRYCGVVFLVIGLVFAFSVVRQITQWRGIGFPSFWGEAVAAITGILVGVICLTAKKA